MRVRAGVLLDGTLIGRWSGWAIVGGVLLIGLASLLGMWLGARRRAEERRQLEVPQFSAQEFQRLTDYQQWVARQAVRPPAPEQPGWPTPPTG